MFDVIVIGLGAMGSAAAMELAVSGQKVLGLEQFSALHDKGSSHGKTRMIRMAYMEGDFYIPLLKGAYEKWMELDALEKRPLINLCGGLYCAPEDDPIITKTLASAKAYGIEVEILSPAQIREIFPVFCLPMNYLGVLEPGAGYTNPAATLDLYHRLSTEAGAVLKFNEQVEGINAVKGKITVRTEEGKYQAKKLVITAGAWLKFLAASLGVDLPLEVWRMALHWFEPEQAASLYKPGSFVPNLWRTPDGGILYGFPWTEEEHAVKYAFHNRQNVPMNPAWPDRKIGRSEVNEIRKAISLFIPGAAHRHLQSKACFYTMTPDEHFVIGQLPGHDNILIAGGFSGHGFKFTPVIGEVLKSLVLEEQIGYDLSAFDLKRFA